MWPNHIGIFTIPINIATKFNIPLIIWGENPQQEYGGPLESIEKNKLTRGWLEEFGGLLGNRIQDMIGVDGLTAKDLTPYFYPSDKELEDAALSLENYGILQFPLKGNYAKIATRIPPS